MHNARPALIVVFLGLSALALSACLGPKDRASLAALEGDAKLGGLSAPVRVERDAIGATRYVAADLLDAVRAQGYVHAQERFAQMDTMRRAAAGRLAELVGKPALQTDINARTVGFHLAAERALGALPERHRVLLDAYSAGVNEGLAAMGGPPPEHRILGVEPEAWAAIDCVHVAYALSAVLLTGHYGEVSNATLERAYSDDPAMLAFLQPVTTRFDALADGVRDYTPLPIPPAGVGADPDAPDIQEPPAPLGSNNFAVGGVRTGDGRAILAGDMHLALTMPPVWRHEQLIFGDRFAAGVALPGAPGIVAGSNGRIAWAFTNVTGDFSDYAVVELDPENEMKHRVSGRWEDISEREEIIRLRGGGIERVVVKDTSWGPIVDETPGGKPLALRRTDIAPEPINFVLLDFATARTLEEGMAAAHAWRGPAQNVLLAESTGRIAWTISGYIPKRRGGSGRTPLLLSEGQGWDGPLDESLRPVIIDPPNGALATANNRAAPAGIAPLLGWQWDLGARAARVHDLIDAHESAIDEEALLQIQLDTRVEVYAAVRPYILSAIDVDDSDRRLRYARSIIERWNGHADADNTEYRLVRWTSLRVLEGAMRAVFAPVHGFDEGWSPGSPLNYTEPALRVLDEQPLSYLPRGVASWRELIRRSVRRALDDIRESDDPRIEAPWGERVALRMSHPLSGALQWLRPELDMPSHPQHGDVLAVRVATRSIGASQRMVVSPGHEEDGIFHMPGGQSGHPFSPHYRSGHEAWRDGSVRPFLPGPTRHRLVLSPAP